MKKLTITSPIISAIAIFAIFTLLPTNALADYTKHHDMPEIYGSITAADSISENLEKAKIHFSVATAVAENAVTDGQAIKGKLGAVQGFLVFKFGVVDGDGLIHKVIVDAGNGFTLYTSEGKSIDDLRNHGNGDKESHDKMMWSHGDKESHDKMMWSHGDKESHDKMMGTHFADLTTEEREAKHAQFKEMKEAFSSLSEEDRETIMAHFKDMKTQFADLSEEERTAKHAEMKTMMEEFSTLSLDEKIVKLQEFADSLR